MALVYGAFFRSQIDCLITELQFFESQLDLAYGEKQKSKAGRHTQEVLKRIFRQLVGRQPILNLVPNQSSIALVYGAFFRSQIDCVTTELRFFENQCFISLNYSYTLTRSQASLTSNRVDSCGGCSGFETPINLSSSIVGDLNQQYFTISVSFKLTLNCFNQVQALLDPESLSVMERKIQ